MSRRMRLPVIGSADARVLLAGCHPDTPLPEALASSGCLLSQPLGADLVALPLRAVQLDWIDVATLAPGTPVFFPAQAGAGVPAPAPVTPGAGQRQAAVSAVPLADGPAASAPESAPGPTPRPADLSPETATQLAYRHDVEEVAAFLRADLSVLVICEKAVVRYLAEHMVSRAGREPRIIQASPAGDTDTEADTGNGAYGAALRLEGAA